jgi:uncharacterized protein (DUF2252 family)
MSRPADSPPKNAVPTDAVTQPVARGFGASTGAVDLRSAGEPLQARRAAGKTLRGTVPFAEQGRWQPEPGRPDPVDLVSAVHADRQAQLVPLRIGRMAASPLSFLRGAASVMAWDLAHTPSTGLTVMIDGDAHLNNFGLYRTPSQEVVFDLNDFDETTLGPWEWDVKRLCASVNVAAREAGAGRGERRKSVMHAAAGYRMTMASLQDMPVLDVWHMGAYADLGHIAPPVALDSDQQAVIARAVERARKRTHATMLGKVAERSGNRWRFREQPPILTHVDNQEKSRLTDGLIAYADTVSGDWQALLRRYHVEDICHRVVGVGSVGTYAYLALLIGDTHGDPLFLQMKQGIVPAAALHLPPLPASLANQGRRVVYGQRLLQTSSDMLLGWTTVDGRDFYVRQMKQMRGSVPVDWLRGATLDYYAWSLGLLLARAHARTGDAATIAGYCGSVRRFDEAMGDWAEAYGDQTVDDHAALCAAIRQGRLKAAIETD